MKTHTATPWKVENQSVTGLDGIMRLNYGIFTGGGNRVALLGHNQKNNAEFIVRACNAHDDLVKALRLAVTHYIGERNSKNVTGESGIAADFIHQVLAKVEGK